MHCRLRADDEDDDAGTDAVAEEMADATEDRAKVTSLKRKEGAVSGEVRDDRDRSATYNAMSR